MNTRFKELKSAMANEEAGIAAMTHSLYSKLKTPDSLDLDFRLKTETLDSRLV